jgi:ATP synthase protein I
VNPWRRLLRPGLLVSAALLVVAALVGGLLRGGSGAAGAAAGVALVAASYAASTLVMAWADGVDRRMLLPVGLITYALKFTVIGAVMAAIAASGWAGLKPMGVALIAAVLAWIVTQGWWTWTAKIPYVDVELPGTRK